MEKKNTRQETDRNDERLTEQHEWVLVYNLNVNREIRFGFEPNQ